VDLTYIKKRRREDPEVPTRVAKLLKAQKGKCTHCGLYFTPTDIVEVDHIIPSVLGGKDLYENLQFLDKRCHDINTARDASLNSYPSPGFPPYKKPGFSKKPGFLIIWLRKLLLRLLHPIYLPQILPTLPNAL
jgi:hypothetical protein